VCVDGLPPAGECLGRHGAEPAGRGEGFQGGQVAAEFRGPDDRTDPSEGAGRLAPHIDAEEGGPAAGRPDEVGHDLDGRGLARSIRTEETKGGPLRDRQVEGLEGGEVTVLLAEALEVNGGIVCGRLFDDGFHRIAIYRDILKSLVNSCAAWIPLKRCEGVFVAGTRRSRRGREPSRVHFERGRRDAAPERLG